MSGQSLNYVTVGEVIDAALGKTVGAANQLPTELQMTALIREISDINAEFYDRGEKDMKKKFWWMEEFHNFNTYAATTLGAAAAANASVLTLTDASNFPAGGGRAFKQPSGDGHVDYFDFGASDQSTQLTTVTNFQLAGVSGDRIELLYATPADFGDAIIVHLDRVPYYHQDPLPNMLPIRPYFTFNGAYMLFPRDTGAHKGTLRYWKQATDLTTNEDDADNRALSTNVPDKYRKYPIFRLAAEIMVVKRRFDLVDRFNLEAEKVYQRAIQAEVNASASPYDTVGPSW
jgi:hypothetical protein